MVIGQTREARRHHSDAVIGLDAGDDLLLLRLAACIVVKPDHLDDGIIRFRSRIDEMRFAHFARRHLHHTLGQRDRGRMRFMRERVVEGQLAHLLRGRFNQPLFAKSNGDAPKTRHRLDIFLAHIVIDIDALTLGDDHRANFFMPAGIRDGMKIIFNVTGGGRIRQSGHHNLRTEGTFSNSSFSIANMAAKGKPPSGVMSYVAGAIRLKAKIAPPAKSPQNAPPIPKIERPEAATRKVIIAASRSFASETAA